jgi:molecular chaperone HscA
VLATRSALAADGSLLDDDERMAIDALVERAALAAKGTDRAAIEAATEALAAGTEAFAAARMNEGIRRALAGKSLDQI